MVTFAALILQSSVRLNFLSSKYWLGQFINEGQLTMRIFHSKAKFSYLSHGKLVRTFHFSTRLHALSKRRCQAAEANIYIYINTSTHLTPSTNASQSACEACHVHSTVSGTVCSWASSCWNCDSCSLLHFLHFLYFLFLGPLYWSSSPHDHSHQGLRYWYPHPCIVEPCGNKLTHETCRKMWNTHLQLVMITSINLTRLASFISINCQILSELTQNMESAFTWGS